MKLRIFVLLFSVFFKSNIVQGQVPSKNASTFNMSVDSIAEKLVSLALNNPRIKISEKAVEASSWDYSRTKTAWANNFTFSANLNEYTIKQTFGADDPLGNRFYPRYNFSTVIPLGLFVNNPKATKAARSRLNASLDAVNIEKQIIRKEVLTLYENYLMQKELLFLQQSLLLDAKKYYESQEQKFKTGKINFEAYLASSKAFNQEQVRELTLLKDIRVTEIQIEELIGMNLNDALQQMDVQNK